MYFDYPGVACGRAIRSYCTGISHGPVSAPIPNANWLRKSFGEWYSFAQIHI